MRFLPLDAPRSGSDFQVVATLGPASFDRAVALATAGATAFRLNASHLSAARAAEIVGRVRRELPEAPLVVDLQGAKMRIGDVARPGAGADARGVRAGETLCFALAPRSPGDVPVPHPELFAAVRAGDTLSVDDGKLRLRVVSVEAGRFEASALGDGRIAARKGVNVLEHPVDLADLGVGDAACLEALAGAQGVAWALSFMKDGAEAEWVRRRANGAALVGKIERAEAVAHLDRLEASVDATWICRGDLGAQIGLAPMARFVASLAPASRDVPMLLAGQVLEHLTAHAEPTRSEVCHLHDVVARGFAGVVLSDETAIGHDPPGAVAHAHALAHAFFAR
jgi:pyruvate kinase